MSNDLILLWKLLLVFIRLETIYMIVIDETTDLYINNLDTGLPSLSIANGNPLKLTSPAQHASRWRMRGSQTCRLFCLCCQLAGCQDDAIPRGTGVYARKFRNEITRAMHAGQERWVWRGRGLAANAAPVDETNSLVKCRLATDCSWWFAGSRVADYSAGAGWDVLFELRRPCSWWAYHKPWSWEYWKFSLCTSRVSSCFCISLYWLVSYLSYYYSCQFRQICGSGRLVWSKSRRSFYVIH